MPEPYAIDLDTVLNLRFYAVAGRDQVHLPLVGGVLRGASQQIMQGALLPVTPEHQGTGQHPEYQHQLIPLLPGGVMLEPGHHHQVDQNALLGLRQPCALPHHPANRTVDAMLNSHQGR